MNPKKILVVDDDEAIRLLCSEILSVAGYSVDTAAHGGEGLEKLEGARYDLVISDVVMPELGGMELYSWSIRKFPRLRGRFLFITGYVPYEMEELASSGAIRYLEKPFRISELLESVEAVMASSLRDGRDNAGGEGGARGQERFALGALCSMTREGGRVEGSMAAFAVDISLGGMKVSYEGCRLEPGERLVVDVEVGGIRIQRRATAVWTLPAGAGPHSSGLKLSERMPVSSIVNIAPAKAAN